MKQFFIIFFVFFLSSQLFAQSVDELILNKKYDDALTLVNSMIQEKPDAVLYFKKALIYEEKSNLTQAVKALETALYYSPKNSVYLAELGDNFSNLGNVYQALECYKVAAANDSDNINLGFKMGRAFISIDDFGNAYQVFSKVYARDSSNVLMNKQFAFAAYKTGNVDQAIKLYEKVLAENPGDFFSHLNLLAIHQKQKNLHKVTETGTRALTIFPGNATLQLRTANALFELNDYQDARPFYASYLAANDSVPDVLKNYGITLYYCNQEDQALTLLEKIFYKTPNDQYVNYYIGLCYKKKADYVRSAEFLNSAIECAQPPYMADMYHQLGLVYGANRDFEKSIDALQKAFDLNNEKVEILFEIATTYEEYNFNKTLALNYYSSYLKTAGEKARNADYALGRIKKIKEELFFENK